MSGEIEKIAKRTKTSIEIAEDLWREVKVHAAKKGLKLFQVFEAALAKYIELEEKEQVEKEKVPKSVLLKEKSDKRK